MNAASALPAAQGCHGVVAHANAPVFLSAVKSDARWSRQYDLLAGPREGKALDELVRSLEPLVQKLARHAYRRGRAAGFPFTSDDLDDLLGEGRIGALLAIRRFDLARGVHLAPYAAWWIRGIIGTWMEQHTRTIRAPRPGSLREVPADTTSFRAMNISARRRTGRISIDQPLAHAEATVLDIIADASPCLEDQWVAETRASLLWAAIARLPERERYVVECRMDEQALEAIGAAMGITGERARQIEEKATWRLRRFLVVSVRKTGRRV